MSRNSVVSYVESPEESTEFEVQAFLWWKLRALGLNVTSHTLEEGTAVS